MRIALMPLPNPEDYLAACKTHLEALFEEADDPAYQQTSLQAYTALRQIVGDLEEAGEPIPTLFLVNFQCEEIPDEPGASSSVTAIEIRANGDYEIRALHFSAPSLESWASTATRGTSLLAYTRSAAGQHFHGQGKMKLIGYQADPSIFSYGTFFDIDSALGEYAATIAASSRCGYLRQAWSDCNTRILASAPEAHFRDSLWNYLKITLRNHTVQREFTVGASKPVDICVDFQFANRTGMIEVKWLGRAVSGSTGRPYDRRPSELNQGAQQLRDNYLARHAREHPDRRLLGYLVVFDGRSNRSVAVRFDQEFLDDPRLRLDHVMALEPYE